MNGCEGYIDLISAYIDGQLNEAEELELKAHLEVCAECRSLLDAMTGISGAMKALEVEPPEGLADGIMYKTRLENAPRPKGRRRFAFGTYTAVAAVLAVVLLAGPNIKNAIEPRNTASSDEAGTYGLRSAVGANPAASADSDKDAVEEYKVSITGADANVSENSSESMFGIASADEKDAGAPKLAYSNFFSGIMVLRGELPDELSDYESIEVMENERHIILPVNALTALKEALDEQGREYEFYDDAPNLSPQAENGIVILYLK